MERTDGRDVSWPGVFDIFDKVNITLVNGENFLFSKSEIAWPRNKIEAKNIKIVSSNPFESYVVLNAVEGEELMFTVCNKRVTFITEAIREIRLYKN